MPVHTCVETRACSTDIVFFQPDGRQAQLDDDLQPHLGTKVVLKQPAAVREQHHVMEEEVQVSESYRASRRAALPRWSHHTVFCWGCTVGRTLGRHTHTRSDLHTHPPAARDKEQQKQSRVFSSYPVVLLRREK